MKELEQIEIGGIARAKNNLAAERGSVTRSNVRKSAGVEFSTVSSNHELPRVTDPRSERIFIKFTRAFTLIELMLVMALLTIVISLVTPSLIGFFQGRSLDSEVRQIVSLTRYGQSRAVSEGIPTVLWVDSAKGTYGLRQETGYVESDPKALDFTTAEGLQLGVDNSTIKSSAGTKLLGIHFSPDGNVITSQSVAGISVRETGRNPVWIVPSYTGLSYEVRN